MTLISSSQLRGHRVRDDLQRVARDTRPTPHTRTCH
jgi:hypothetical protein